MAKQRIEIPLVGGHYKRPGELKIDAQECVNLYPVIDISGGRRASLKQVHGLTEWLDIGVTDEVRALFEFDESTLYAFVGSAVYSIDTLKNKTLLTGSLSTGSGRLQIESNGTQVIVCDLDTGDGYVIESGAVTKITDSDFPTVSSLTYQDGYAIVSASGTKNFYISTLDAASVAAYNASDFTRWSALDYSTASGLSSDLGAIISNHEELWAFGSNQIGFYYDSGSSDFPFSKSQHPFQEVGLGSSPSTIVSIENALYWLDSSNDIRRAAGYTPETISTPEISAQIEGFGTVSDAFAFSYRYEGQPFYCITFPSEKVTYVYGVLSNIWHTRKSGISSQTRWKANCYSFFNRTHMFGDYQNGVIYEIDDDTFEDAATRVTKYTDSQRRRVTYWRVELHMVTGVGNVVAPGDDPKVMLSWSDDGGATWSNEKFAQMGKIGERFQRVFWNKLGQSRERTFKVRITDPVPRTLIALYADVTVEGS